jgi:hypothetical protein
MRGKAILLAALLAMALVPAIAAAQATSGSFADLARSERLHEGKDITITFWYEASAGYEEVEAEVASMNASSITIIVGKLPMGRTDLPVNRREGRYGRWEIQIPERRVQSIVVAGEGMPRWAGGLIGAGAGYGAGMLVAIACINANETGDGCDLPNPGAVVMGLVGGGAALGAVLTGKSDPEEVYRSNTLPEQLSSHIEWSVVPVIVKDHKAAVFTIKW